MNIVTLSVVIATYNQPGGLLRLLKSISTQLDKSCEVVIVDDGSHTDYTNIINEDWPFVLKYIKANHGGGTLAKNVGAQNAVGEYLFFLDDDIVVEDQYFSNLLVVLMNHDKVITVGQLLMPGDNFRQNSDVIEEAGYHSCLGGFMAIKRDNFLNLGQFEGLGSYYPNWEDVIFGYKASQLHFIVYRVLNAIAYHFDKKLNLETSKDYWYYAASLVPKLEMKYPGISKQFDWLNDIKPIDFQKDQVSLIIKKILRRLISTKYILGFLEMLYLSFEGHLHLSNRLLIKIRYLIISSSMVHGYRIGINNL